jgi:hypothetical protein
LVKNLSTFASTPVVELINDPVPDASDFIISPSVPALLLRAYRTDKEAVAPIVTTPPELIVRLLIISDVEITGLLTVDGIITLWLLFGTKPLDQFTDRFQLVLVVPVHVIA